MEVKIKRIFQEQKFNKNGKSSYMYVAEVENDNGNLQVKLISFSILSEGDVIKLPYLITDYQKYAFRIS
jgi:hypothetical protein